MYVSFTLKIMHSTQPVGISPVCVKSFSGKDGCCFSEVTVLFFCADTHITPPVCKKNKAGTIMFRPKNTGTATSALFEMKKGAAFSVRQDQQNDAQIFVILF